MVEVLFAVTFLKKRGQYMNANTIDASKKGQAKPVPPGGQDKFEIATHDGNPSNEDVSAEPAIEGRAETDTT